MDRAGGAHVLDINCGVMLGRARVATEFFKENEVGPSRMMEFLFGEEGKRAAVSLAFQPDATKENITPKPEDFVAADFRLLTATVVGAWSWKATDFSNEKMLKASVGMLDRKPVYTDHNTNVANWVGIVSKPTWQEKSTAAGVMVPPGINATLLIDSKTRPEIARGVMLGSISSNSVTVEFEWEMSHDFEREWDFLDKIGDTGKDGEMVRRVVTKVTGYHETSLVWMGADPFAKLLDPQGKLTSVDKGHVYSKLDKAVKDDYEKEKRFSLSFAFDPAVVRLARQLQDGPTPPTPAPTTDPTMNPKLIAALLTHFKLSKAEEITDAHVEQFNALVSGSERAERFTQLAAVGEAGTAKLVEKDKAGFDAFVKDHTIVSTQRHGELIQAEKDLKALQAAGDPVKLKRELDEANTANTALKADAELGKGFLKLKREQAMALYKKQVGAGKEDQAVIDMYMAADSKTIDGLLKQHGKEAAVKFSATCTKCDSNEHIAFRSSVEDAPKEGGEAPKGRSIGDIRERHSASGFNLREQAPANK